jgi:ribosomal protein S15P/S13E
MPESRLQKLRKESERYSTDIKEKEADNNVFRKQIREIKATIHQTQRDYHATAKGTSKAENQRIKMQKLLKRQKLANEVNAQEKEIAELRLELKRLSKKTFPQFDDTL